MARDQLLGRTGVAACGLAVAAWLVFAPPCSAAQGRSIRFEKLSISEGLSEGTVTCILQDAVGFLWLGTQDGLNRYDGSRFVVFKNDPDDPASLSHDWIRALYEDADGDLWIGTRGGGLDRMSRETGEFRHYRHDPDDPASLAGDRVWFLFQDRRGALWVATEQSGLDRFDPETGTFEHHRHDPADPTSLSSDQVRTVYEDRSGRLWVGTMAGLNLYRPGGGFIRFRHDPDDPTSLADDGVRSILEDRDGRLWIGTLGGLNRLRDGVADDPRALAFDRFRHDPATPASLSENRVRVLYEDRDGRLWVGTDGGLNLVDRDAGSFVHFRHRADEPHSLSIDRVASIYQDRGGVLWVGTEGGGVNKWDPFTWTFSNDSVRPSELSSQYILSIATDRRGGLWLGTNGHGLNRVERATGRVEHFRHRPEDARSLADDRVTALFTDRAGALWVGTLAGGLDRFDFATETFEHFVHDPARADSLGANGVMAIFEDRRGRLWIGTFGGGLNRLEDRAGGGRFARYRHDPDDPRSLSDDRVTAFAEAPGGVLWVGTFSAGLNRFDRATGVFQRMAHDPQAPHSLSSDTVFALLLDRSGTLWVGTQNGLDRLERFDPKTGEASFRRYLERDGLASDFIYSIYEDDEGMLWLSTNRGLSRFDPRRERFKNFDTSHGLLSIEFNMGAHHQDRSGELFFGGIDGFNSFFPDRIERNTAVPPVVFTSFSKLNQPVRLERPIYDVDQVLLGPGESTFSFEYAALDYTAPARNRYRYKLEGFDDEWVDVGNRRRVSFTNLDPGAYVLRVQGSNHDGVWNQTGAAMRIVVAPPWWRTWWAYGLYLSVLVLAVWSVVDTQQRKIERERAIAARERAQAQERQRLLEERDRLISDLESKNTELERFTYTVSHDLKSPLVTIKGFLGLLRQDADAGDRERLEHDIERIGAAADKMGILLDDVLELSRVGRQLNPPEAIRTSDLVSEAVELIGGRIDENGVEIRVAAAMPSIYGDRSRLLEVFQNLLENAVKYMGDQQEPRIEVGIESRRRDRVTVFVRDNGIGIEPPYQDKVFELFERLDAREEGNGVGLALVKSIVELHGGGIRVESAGAGMGTTFFVTLPTPPADEWPEAVTGGYRTSAA